MGFRAMPKANQHDHVGSMVFKDKKCYCTECGQQWWLGENEWVTSKYPYKGYTGKGNRDSNKA